MNNYLDEVEIEQKDVEEFKDFNIQDWMMYYIEAYGYIENMEIDNFQHAVNMVS